MTITAETVILDKYRIVRLIDTGGMARVWLAEESAFGQRQVAIKEPLRNLDDASAQEVRQRFEQELKVCAALEHAHAPNIVRAITSEQVDGQKLLVMEYLPGGDLAQQLKQNADGLPIVQAVTIAGQLLAALRVAHDHPWEIIHRDIKPSNILFDAAGAARLSDFGLAQLAGMSQRSQLQGQPHPGTPAYMAPEQANSTQALTPAADVYALGAVFFEMLTGKRYNRVAPGTRVSALRPATPATLDAVVARALAPDPYARYHSAGEMADALAAATAPSATRAAAGDRRRAGLLLVAGLTVLALLIGGAFMWLPRSVGSVLPLGGAPWPPTPAASAADASRRVTPDATTAMTATQPTIAAVAVQLPADTATPTPTETPTQTVTAIPTETPTEMPSPTATNTPAPTTTPAPTSTLTPTATPDHTATAAVEATHLAAAVAATLTAAAPTPTPSATATATATATRTPNATTTARAEETAIVRAIIATLTAAAPTPTRTPTATRTPNAAATTRAEATALVRSILASLTAAAPTPTQTSTVTPSPISTPPAAPVGPPEPMAPPEPPPPPTATPLPVVNCTVGVDGGFQAFYTGDLGCASGPARVTWASFTPMQRGFLQWRDDTKQVYGFFGDGGWRAVPDTWDGSSTAEVSRGAPPPGLLTPIRGTGNIWGTDDDFFNRLGWAIDEQQGICATVQDFQNGFLQRPYIDGTCKDGLFNHAANNPGFPLQWVRAFRDGRWSGVYQ